MAWTKKHTNDDKKTQFGIWLGLPVEGRKDDERTEEQFSKKLGVSPKSLVRWKDDAHVQEIARNAVKVFFGNDSYDVVKEVVKQAKGGSAPHARLFLEYNGDIGTAVKKRELPKQWKITLIEKVE